MNIFNIYMGIVVYLTKAVSARVMVYAADTQSHQILNDTSWN